VTVLGIDVSHYQGSIDWGKVAAAGKQFAYAKMLDGVAGYDTTYEVNVGAGRAAQNAGLLAGAYQFVRPLQDATAQAEAFAKYLLEDASRLALPPMMDVEESFVRGVDQWLTLTLDARLAALTTYVARLVALTGKVPVLYTRAGYWTSTFGDSDALSRCQLWLAQYPDPNAALPTLSGPRLPSAWSRWDWWQYSGSGKCDGVSGQVDLDAFNGTLQDLQTLGR
jgi:lysozyme